MRFLIAVMVSTIAGKPRVLKVYVDVDPSREQGRVACPALAVEGCFDVAAGLIGEHEMSDNEPLWVAQFPLTLESADLAQVLRQAAQSPQSYTFPDRGFWHV